MSTIKHPVGPQSSKVYWRRRLVVGLGLLFVLVIIILIIVRPGSSSGEPGDGAQPAASAPATDAPNDPNAADDPNADPNADAAAAAAGLTTCNPAKVQVEAITDADSYEPGVVPQLSLSITNTGSAACNLNAGTAKQVFTVSSGADVYWTSTDCQTESSDAEVTLEPTVPVSSTTPVAWDRVRSSPDTCDSETRPAAPGGGAYYLLTVSVDGIESTTPKQFILY